MYASSHACSVYLLEVTSHDGIPEFEMMRSDFGR